MAPQRRGIVPEGHLERIEAARQAAQDAERLLKEVTVAALVAGASYPELSKSTGFSTATLQRWVRELGATPAGRTCRALTRAQIDEFEQRLAEVRELLAQGWDGVTPIESAGGETSDSRPD